MAHAVVVAWAWWQVLRLRLAEARAFAQDDNVRVARRFYVGLTALWILAVLTQGVALGWDMAAPLALNEGEGQEQIPCGNGKQKGNGKDNCNPQYRDLSTALRSGRDGRFVRVLSGRALLDTPPFAKAQRVGHPELA